MVAARISRQSAEAFADANAPASVTRLDVEVAAEAETANTVDPIQVSRQSIEVFGKRTATVSLTRVEVEVAAEAEAANAVDPVQVSRQSAEAFINISPRAALTRLDVELAAEAETANAVDPVQVSRQTGEVFARRGSAGPVVPLALGADNELFLHDWADELRLTSGYSTDVSISPFTGAEARVVLNSKPERSLEIVWREERDALDAAGASRLDRMYVFLRRVGAQRVAIPLYQDARTLGAHLSSDTTILFDTSRGRWFVGARVAVVRPNFCGGYTSHSFHLIADMQDDRLELDSALGTAAPAGSIVLPMMDCELTLEVEWSMEHGCLAEVSATFEEVAGPSQLPASRSDTPSGFPTHLGVPILAIEPDWSDPVGGGRSRQGVAYRSGRSRSVGALAGRSRHVAELPFTNERPEYWRLIEFFDTRRGRGRSFWSLDQDQLWRVAALDPNFVSVVPFGDFDDFKEELEGGYVGLTMRDGTFYVRDAVTVQSVASVYRITVSPTLPGGLDPLQVSRVARARRVRFAEDSMEEVWTHAGLAETSLRTIETLNEIDSELS